VRFYVVSNDRLGTFDCAVSLRAAHAAGQSQRSVPAEPYSIERVDCLVNAETVRRLLGQLGGYAIDTSTREYGARGTP
jgi:hypothetical protein